jgi:hypothetical protein
MARRRAGKANPKSAALRGGSRRAQAKTARPPASEGTLVERVAALERERDVLRAELKREQARRLALEEVYAATRDRIAWALDSLQRILDAKADQQSAAKT